VVREPVEDEEEDRQDEDDGEDPAAQGLAQCVADDDPDARQLVASPTVSR
jgi:hypothetical protein